MIDVFRYNEAVADALPTFCRMAQAIPTVAHNRFLASGMEFMRLGKDVEAGLMSFSDFPSSLEICDNLGDAEPVFILDMGKDSESRLNVKELKALNLDAEEQRARITFIGCTWENCTRLAMAEWHEAKAGTASSNLTDRSKWGIYWEWIESEFLFLTMDEATEISRCIAGDLKPAQCRMRNALGYFLFFWDMMNRQKAAYLEGLKIAKIYIGKHEEHFRMLRGNWLNGLSMGVQASEVDSYISKYGVPAWALKQDVIQPLASRMYSTPITLPAIAFPTDKVTEALRKYAHTPYTGEAIKLQLLTKKGSGRPTEKEEVIRIGFDGITDTKGRRVSDTMLRISFLFGQLYLTAKAQGIEEPYFTIDDLYRRHYGAHGRISPEEKRRFIDQLEATRHIYIFAPSMVNYADMTKSRIKPPKLGFEIAVEEFGKSEDQPLTMLSFTKDNNTGLVLGARITGASRFLKYALLMGHYIPIYFDEYKVMARTISRGLNAVSIFAWIKNQYVLAIKFKDSPNHSETLKENGVDVTYIKWHGDIAPLAESLGYGITEGCKDRTRDTNKIIDALETVIELMHSELYPECVRWCWVERKTMTLKVRFKADDTIFRSSFERYIESNRQLEKRIAKTETKNKKRMDDLEKRLAAIEGRK